MSKIINKFLLITFALSIVFICACSNQQNLANNSSPNKPNNGKNLIVYFSLPENNGEAKENSTIKVDGSDIGNTEYVANLINEKIGADVFRIIPVKNYDINNHENLVNDARKEQRENARPEIKDSITNFDDYDNIYLGYPIWWSDLPMILYTFIENNNFSGKNVYVFSTHGGSGLAGTMNTLKNKLVGANINSNALSIYRDNMETAPAEVEKWLNTIK